MKFKNIVWLVEVKIGKLRQVYEDYKGLVMNFIYDNVY